VAIVEVVVLVGREKAEGVRRQGDQPNQRLLWSRREDSV